MEKTIAGVPKIKGKPQDPFYAFTYNYCHERPKKQIEGILEADVMMKKRKLDEDEAKLIKEKAMFAAEKANILAEIEGEKELLKAESEALLKAKNELERNIELLKPTATTVNENNPTNEQVDPDVQWVEERIQRYHVEDLQWGNIRPKAYITKTEPFKKFYVKKFISVDCARCRKPIKMMSTPNAKGYYQRTTQLYLSHAVKCQKNPQTNNNKC